MKVVVSGASGFVGRAVSSYLHASSDHQVMGLQRRAQDLGFPSRVVPTLSDEALLVSLLLGQDVVVHCAAAVHRRVTSPQAMHKVNVDLTLSLARAAARAGCHRFVFVSSIGVNGSLTYERPFSENDVPKLNGPYAASKWAAEQALTTLAAQTGMELVVVRPPLVYGWQAPGNFASLVNWISRGWPLPLALAKENRRSYVGIDNLVGFLSLCVSHPKAGGQTFLVSDDETISTADLVENIAAALGCKSYLWPLPLSWMRLVAQLAGQEEAIHRLFGNLEVNTSKARTMLDWRPELTMGQQLKTDPRKSEGYKC